MGIHRTVQRLLPVTCLLLLAALPAVEAQSAKRSSLSRWLGDEATPEIRQLLAQHPRYRDASVQLVRADRNGLAEALVTVLNMNLQGREGIQLHTPTPYPTRPLRVAAGIDGLDCSASPQRHHRLLVSVRESDRRSAVVTLTLIEAGGSLDEGRNWQWRGRLSGPERDTFSAAVNQASGLGTLESPWENRDVEAAATDLHRQLACALRPQLRTRLGLNWSEGAYMPAQFTDVLNHSRHLLGDYAELAFTEEDPDYTLSARLTPFQNGVWQLWLNAEPARPGLSTVQAVAYFRHDGQTPSGVPYRLATTLPPVSPVDRGDPLEFLDVQMLDTWQGDAGPRRAELQVQLKLQNRSDWPIDYAFRLSGGHYQHCVPNPAYYRHDGYGRLTGRLDPGESRVQEIVIKNAQHRPNPWTGPRKCAGFRSLEGFEAFDSKGDTVTDYVRWSM